MAMTRRLWSINALATELSMDRRTIAKRLSGHTADGEIKGHPAWHLDTALGAIQGRARPAPEAPPIPPGMDSLASLPAGDQLVLIALAEVATCAPAMIAALAVDQGAAEPSAGPVLERIALGGLVTAMQQVLDALDMEGDLAALLSPERIAEAGVRWGSFPGFDQAKAAGLVAEFQESA